MSNTTTADTGQEGEKELKHTLSSYLAYGASNGPQDEPPLAWQRKDQSKPPIRLGMRDVAPKTGLMASHESNAHASALRTAARNSAPLSKAFFLGDADKITSVQRQTPKPQFPSLFLNSKIDIRSFMERRKSKWGRVSIMKRGLDPAENTEKRLKAHKSLKYQLLATLDGAHERQQLQDLTRFRKRTSAYNHGVEDGSHDLLCADAMNHDAQQIRLLRGLANDMEADAMREIREKKSQAAREEEDALAAAELAYEQALLGYQVTPFEDSLHGYIECDAALQRTRKRFVGFPPRPSEGIAEQLPRKLASIQNDFYTLRRPEFVQSMKMLQICDVTELGSPGAEQADENQMDDCNEAKPRQCSPVSPEKDSSTHQFPLPHSTPTSSLTRHYQVQSFGIVQGDGTSDRLGTDGRRLVNVDDSQHETSSKKQESPSPGRSIAGGSCSPASLHGNRREVLQRQEKDKRAKAAAVFVSKRVETGSLLEMVFNSTKVFEANDSGGVRAGLDLSVGGTTNRFTQHESAVKGLQGREVMGSAVSAPVTPRTPHLPLRLSSTPRTPRGAVSHSARRSTPGASMPYAPNRPATQGGIGAEQRGSSTRFSSRVLALAGAGGGVVAAGGWFGANSPGVVHSGRPSDFRPATSKVSDNINEGPARKTGGSGGIAPRSAGNRPRTRGSVGVNNARAASTRSAATLVPVSDQDHQDGESAALLRLAYLNAGAAADQELQDRLGAWEGAH